MTIGISEKPSLLSALLASASPDQAAPGSGTPFAGKLDAVMENTAITPANAQALAETLNLQMLHSTLALSGDQPAETSLPQPFSRQSAAVQSLLDSYRANQAEADASPRQASPQPLSSQPESYGASASLPGDSQWLEPIIDKASRQHGVDPGLIKAVIKAESGFNPRAVSSAGARGLMQLMPATARGLGVDDAFDPEQNVMAGTRFLRDLLNRYNGDIDSTLAAYNWGPGNVDRHPDRLPRETRAYLTRVKQLYASYSA
jgi:soluble lytic murein transglycosylase-like protein